MADNNNKDDVEPLKHSGIQVIARASAIMRVLGDEPKGLSLGAIASRTNLPRSTVQRIVQALEVEEIVEACEGNMGVKLGPELARLIYKAQLDVVSMVHPLLQDLSKKLNESIVLCGLEDLQVVVLDRVVAKRDLRVVFPIGAIRLPLHLTAPGKAFKAYMKPQKIKQLLTVLKNSSQKQLLLAELEKVRTEHIAVDNKGYSEEVVGMAVAVETLLGRYAVAVVIPKTRIGNIENEVKLALTEFKARIEARLGGAHPEE